MLFFQFINLIFFILRFNTKFAFIRTKFIFYLFFCFFILYTLKWTYCAADDIGSLWSILSHLSNIKIGLNDQKELLEYLLTLDPFLYDPLKYLIKNNFTSLVNIDNIYEINCLNNRVFNYSNGFKNPKLWEEYAVGNFHDVDDNLQEYLLEIKREKNSQSLLRVRLDVWAYVYLGLKENKKTLWSKFLKLIKKKN